MEALVAPVDGDSAQSEASLRDAVRQMVHRSNNFLSVVATRAEVALAKDDPELRRRALETILAEARKHEEFMRATRRAALGG